MTKVLFSKLISDGTNLLSSKNIQAPYKTTLTILCNVLNLDLAKVIAYPETEVTEELAQEIQEMFNRRALGEPVQYIIGYQEFYGLKFQVTQDVLIPRPETELIVEFALKYMEGKSNPQIIDIGTGSGCLAVTLAVHLPNARITAVDISQQALVIAIKNAAYHTVTNRINFLKSDFFSEVPKMQANLIVSNPPYIASEELQGLQKEVRDYEPKEALISGPEGVESYVQLFLNAKHFLVADGILIVEIGFGQCEKIVQLGIENNWKCEQIAKDLQGIPRTIIFRKL